MFYFWVVSDALSRITSGLEARVMLFEYVARKAARTGLLQCVRKHTLQKASPARPTTSQQKHGNPMLLCYAVQAH